MSHYETLRRFYPDLPKLPDPDSIDIESWTPENPREFLEPIDRMNVWHRIEPEALRGRLLRIHNRLLYEDKKAAQDAEDDRKAALRGPPTNCRREGSNGHLLRWDPPSIDGGEQPESYIVEAFRNGEWTTLQPPIYPHEPLEKVLYSGITKARVSAYYPNEPQRLGWGFRRGPILGAPQSSRMDAIVSACRRFKGRRMRDGRPWVRPLRKEAGMPDITTTERNEAHKRSK